MPRSDNVRRTPDISPVESDAPGLSNPFRSQGASQSTTRREHPVGAVEGAPARARRALPRPQAHRPRAVLVRGAEEPRHLTTEVVVLERRDVELAAVALPARLHR